MRWFRDKRSVKLDVTQPWVERKYGKEVSTPHGQRLPVALLTQTLRMSITSCVLNPPPAWFS